MAQYPNFNFNGSRQSAVRRTPMPRPPAHTPPPEAEKQSIPPPQPDAPSCTPPPSPAESPQRDIQSLLTGWDGERIALLALLYLLYKEGTDLTLLLALAYILL